MIDSAGRSNHMEFNYLQRVKVYRLNDEGKWDDKGTGHVSVEYLERSDAVGLVVIDEEDNQTLLVHRISADNIYRRQEDTIVSWTDPEVATDLALSFQETMGCTFIWDQICSVRRSINFPNATGLNGSVRPGGDDLEHSGTSQDDGGTEGFELPPVELANLPQIAKALGEVSPFEKDRVASLVVRDQNYIRKLVEMFRTCEDLENDEGLHYMYKIVKGIISLNDGNIFDIIFSDDFIFDIIGALEYDPELTTRQNHRAYLTEQVTFKEAVPIHDRAVLSKIHQTYRIGYIKDVILPRVLDDQTFATMNSIILFNNVSVVTSLQNDSAFLSELFSKLRSPETPEKNRRDLVFFIQEFCNLSKHLQPGVRSQLLSALAKEGLFDIVKDILNDAEESVRLSGCDILIVILNNDPALLRSFLVHQTSHALFSELITGMLTPREGGLQAQLLEIMRMLLDSETMDATQVEKSPFLEIFYEKYMDQMVEVLTSGCPPEPGALVPSKESDDSENKSKPHVTPEILGNICELLCFCVQHHRFRIKYYVMRKHVVEKVLRLTRRKEKYLVVAAVRFLRTCISLKEEFYYRYIVKNNCFEPIISAFVANGNRYNLLNSAVLDVIDCIRKDGIKSLIVHLVETYSSKLESIDYVDTFRALKMKYDQMLESPSGFAGGAAVSGGPDHGSRGDKQGQGGVPESRKRKDERALDKDEEDYFNEDSDDEEDTPAANLRASSGLKSANVGTLNKPRTPNQRSLSDDEEDTASAKLRTSAGQQSPKAVILISKNIALSNVPYRGNMFGLVDYEDEEDEIPMNNLGSNGKDDGGGKVLEKESDSLLTSIPLSDPIWSNLEDATVAKRKSPPTPDLDQNDAVLLKRQKPQAIESSSDVRGTLTSIDDSEELAFSTRNAEVLESAPELLTKRPDTDTSKIEEPKPAENGTVVSVSESNHTVGGDGAEDLSCPNGKVSSNTLSRDMVCPNRNGNGSTDSDGEVAIPSGGHEDPNLHNGIRGGDGNGANATSDNGVGQDCNGVKRDGSIKGELSNGSLDSENKKMTSLSSTELHRAVTPTSPGPFTVR